MAEPSIPSGVDSLLKAILECSPDGVLLVDGAGNVLYRNRRFFELWDFDLAMDGIYNAHFLRSLAVERLVDPDAFLHLIEHYMDKANRNLTGTDLLYFKNGRILERHTGPLFDRSNRYYGRIWFFRDITERKQAELAATYLVRRNQLLMQSTSEGVHILDDEVNIIEANDAFCRHLGYTPEEILRLNVFDFEAKLTHDEVRANLNKFLDGGGAVFESVHRRKDGTLVDVEVHISGVELDGEKCIFALSRDITARKRAEAELRIAATAFEAEEGMMVTDASRVILRVNRAFSKITGYSAEEAVGQTPRLLYSGCHDAAFYAGMWENINRTGTWQGEIWNRRKNGDTYPERLTITAVKGEDGAISHYVGTLHDITERKQTEAQIIGMAFHDALTGLPNRRLLTDRLEHAMAASRRSGHHGALMFLDLDNFKPLNDLHGHDMGDLLLQEAARRLSSCVRQIDTVARFGGDEFMVMLDQLHEDRAASEAHARQVAGKIRAALEQPYVLTLLHGAKEGTAIEHRCTSSIGVALFLDHAGKAADIIKRADIAMYQAKSAGPNQIQFYQAPD